MNIQVKFFGQLRELLDCEECEISLDVQTEQATVAEVKLILCQKGLVWQKNLDNGKVLMAVNHELISAEHIVKIGDEVAFFPPVTGG